MRLRPYQKESVKELFNCWKYKPKSKPLIVAPTGSGKSLICAEICRRVRKGNSAYMVYVLSHRKEIIEQNAKKIFDLLGEQIGIYSQSLKEKSIRPITVAQIQSIYKKKVEANLIIIDEAHLLSSKDTSMYQKFLNNIQTFNPKVCGLTATPFRLDVGNMIGDNSFFTDIAYDIKILELIELGYLCPVISKRGLSEIDLKSVRTSGKDYRVEDLEAKFEPLLVSQVKEILQIAPSRNHILVFCTSIKHCRQVCEALQFAGVAAEYVTGEMVTFERDRKINDFKSGKIKILCNVDILTTGFDFPALDCIAILRSTKSTSLYMQIVGRGMRPHETKENLLLLDYGQNIIKHGPIDCIEVETKEKGDGIGIAPFKECPSCSSIVAARSITCPDCGFEFPVVQAVEYKASEAAPMSVIEEIEVTGIKFKQGQKEGKPPYLMVTYKLGDIGQANQFVCIEHEGFAKRKAQDWFRNAFDGVKYSIYEPNSDYWPQPETVQEIINLAIYFKTPIKIHARKKGKFWDVLNVEWKAIELKEDGEVVEEYPF